MAAVVRELVARVANELATVEAIVEANQETRLSPFVGYMRRKVFDSIMKDLLMSEGGLYLDLYTDPWPGYLSTAFIRKDGDFKTVGLAEGVRSSLPHVEMRGAWPNNGEETLCFEMISRAREVASTGFCSALPSGGIAESGILSPLEADISRPSPHELGQPMPVVQEPVDIGIKWVRREEVSGVQHLEEVCFVRSDVTYVWLLVEANAREVSAYDELDEVEWARAVPGDQTLSVVRLLSSLVVGAGFYSSQASFRAVGNFLKGLKAAAALVEEKPVEPSRSPKTIRSDLRSRESVQNQPAPGGNPSWNGHWEILHDDDGPLDTILLKTLLGMGDNDLLEMAGVVEAGRYETHLRYSSEDSATIALMGVMGDDCPVGEMCRTSKLKRHPWPTMVRSTHLSVLVTPLMVPAFLGRVGDMVSGTGCQAVQARARWNGATDLGAYVEIAGAKGMFEGLGVNFSRVALGAFRDRLALGPAVVGSFWTASLVRDVVKCVGSTTVRVGDIVAKTREQWGLGAAADAVTRFTVEMLASSGINCGPTALDTGCYLNVIRCANPLDDSPTLHFDVGVPLGGVVGFETDSGVLMRVGDKVVRVSAGGVSLKTSEHYDQSGGTLLPEPLSNYVLSRALHVRGPFNGWDPRSGEPKLYGESFDYASTG
eukprot:g15174.t1